MFTLSELLTAVTFAVAYAAFIGYALGRAHGEKKRQGELDRSLDTLADLLGQFQRPLTIRILPGKEAPEALVGAEFEAEIVPGVEALHRARSILRAHSRAVPR